MEPVVRIAFQFDPAGHWIGKIIDGDPRRVTADSIPNCLEKLRDSLPPTPLGVEIIEHLSRPPDYWEGVVYEGYLIPRACDECRGSGKYVGLVHVDSCKSCKGIGRIYTPADAAAL